MKNKRLIKYAIFSLLYLVGLYFFIKYRRELFNIKNLRAWVLSYGQFSVAIFILFYALKPVVIFFPSWILSVVAGNLYGTGYAFLISMVGCFLSATVSFYLGRYLGQAFVDKILKGKAVSLDKDIEKHGFKIMLIMRLSYIFPYDALSYAAGLSKMRYIDFISGTMLGILPEFFAYSMIGKNLEHPFSKEIYFPIIIVAVIALLTYFISKKSKKQLDK